MAKKVSTKELNAGTDAFLRANSLIEPIRLQAWDNLGLTVTQLRLLFHLSQKDGMSNAELADKLSVTRPSVSALLERLERNGFIRREISLADRRGIRILLEPAGRDALAGAKDDVRKPVSGILAALDEDQMRQATDGMLVIVNSAGRK